MPYVCWVVGWVVCWMRLRAEAGRPRHGDGDGVRRKQDPEQHAAGAAGHPHVVLVQGEPGPAGHAARAEETQSQI